MTTVKKIWSIVTTVLVAFMVLFAVFLMGSRLIGYRCFNVISPSMEPKYSVGDLIYVKEVDPSTIKEGDVITFLLNEELTVGTHRVVRVDTEKQYFYTKGDANEIEDAEPVHFKNVIGVPQFSIPLLGYVSDYVQNPPGTYVVIGIFAVLILLVFLPDLLGLKKEKELSPELVVARSEAMTAKEENDKLREQLERLRSSIAERASEPVSEPEPSPEGTSETVSSSEE